MFCFRERKRSRHEEKGTNETYTGVDLKCSNDHWQYASHGHSKFGLESINGKEKGYTFTPKAIKEHLDRFAALIDVPIYGGDAIIDADGNFWIIDFNDFPSFSSCRDEAAKAIAKRITL